MAFIILFYNFILLKSNTIFWFDRRYIKYDDFKKVYSTNMQYSANTLYKFNFDYKTHDDSIKYVIYSYFICDSSYICCQDSILLAHEQGHFDISEIYARMLRKNTIELINKYSSLDSIQYYINSLFESIDIDDVYDTETNHGTITTENERWKIKIEKMLDSLSDYDKPIGTISIK
jgi:hypothetical protein